MSEQQSNRASSSKKMVVYEDIPVYNEIIKEVPYYETVDNVIEREVENRYYVDEIIKNPIRKVNEVEVEKTVEKQVIIPKEKIVERVQVVEKPVEKIVEVPVDVIEEENVPVEVIKNIKKERLTVRPHRTEVHEEVQYVNKEITVDKYVEKEVFVGHLGLCQPNGKLNNFSRLGPGCLA